MGDRTNCTRLDRTNGFNDGRDYVRVKNSKLAQQNDQIREALRSRNSTMRTDLFKGISVNVNGRTQPTADELKRLILLNGGEYHPYYRYQTTKFMIATNLSAARTKNLRPDDRVVRPEWITDSIQAKCLLPYQDYQIFNEEPRGKTGTVLTLNEISGPSSMMTQSASKHDDNLAPTIVGYNQSYRKSKQKAVPEVKSRDIRDMFSNAIRSKRIEEFSGSQKSNEAGNSRDTIISNAHHDESSNSRDSISLARDSQAKTETKKSNKLTMSAFVIRGEQQSRFPVPKIPEKKSQANICGLSDIDDVISLLNEWVGCPEGIRDDDQACVTKYFYDLMSEKNYHNKFYEIIDAFKQRVIQHDDPNWVTLHNDLIRILKEELNQNAEASQNLCQLLTPIDCTKFSNDHATGHEDDRVVGDDVEPSSSATSSPTRTKRESN